MSDSQEDLSREEYTALRATIRERGTLRHVLFVATVALWGALALLAAAMIGTPVSTLVPLLVLASGYEAVAALHIGVERVGRYLQVRFEGDRGDAAQPLTSWERTAMAWGARFPGTGTDPLFGIVFLLAALLNYLPVVLTGIPLEMVVYAAVHALFIWRVLHVRRWAARQRSEDLARFRQLL